MRIAAVGDLHVRERPPSAGREFFSEISNQAEVLLLCGDLTDFGLPEEAKKLAEYIAVCRIPVFGILGNHDYQSDKQSEVRRILMDGNMKFVDEEAEVVNGYGFAGVKGFGGGFGNHMLASFGENIIKSFVAESVRENLLLENLLRDLTAEKIVVMLHYAPIAETLKGESPELYQVLGTSRLAETIDRFSVAAVFHGHSHHGSLIGKTAKGVPVYNCTQSVLRQRSNKDALVIEI